MEMLSKAKCMMVLDLSAFGVLCLALGGALAQRQQISREGSISRADFPPNFIFGAASSAYQYEGASRDDGKGPSIWDTFTEQTNTTADGSTGNVADDEYHRYKEDIKLISHMGMDSYRFSISWSRVMPLGRGKVNQLGIEYYNNLINGLLEKGIQPFVTLYHFDLPQALQDAYGGWLDSQIVDDFATFAETCFIAFGDRVKHWLTLNEPAGFILSGYNNGIFPPARCSKSVGNCTSGNSSTEPYIAGHNVLLSHAAAVDIYRSKYQKLQGGSIGITVNTVWYIPLTDSSEDTDAVQRALDFFVGWFLDPILLGDYPLSMRMRVKTRLPSFSDAQRNVLEASVDFVGINYYTTYFVGNAISSSHREGQDFYSDVNCYLTGVHNGVPIGPQAASNWLFIVPSGIYHMVDYLKSRYNNPALYITENGVDEAVNSSLPLKEALRDHTRVQYHKDHLSYLSKVMSRQGADVRGYFAWSLLDDFEWLSGYKSRFGLHYVDRQTLKRHPKTSAHWFARFLSKARGG